MSKLQAPFCGVISITWRCPSEGFPKDPSYGTKFYSGLRFVGDALCVFGGYEHLLDPHLQEYRMPSAKRRSPFRNLLAP